MWYGNSLRSSRGYTTHSEHRLAARRSNPTYSDILSATKAAVRVFEARGTPVCAVGGLACKLLGNPRMPNDVDLLLLDTVSSQEQLKQTLVNANSQFYLIPARDPLATYKVLWYRTAADVRVKVDLLQPGIMSIPNISPREIEHKDTSHGGTRARIPLAPFGLVLLLKLQAWEQHRDSSEYRFREKQYTDARDINVLLPLAVADQVTFDSLPSEFLGEARKRVVLYTGLYPETERSWQELGLIKATKRQAPTATVSHARTSTSRYSRAAASYARTDELASLFDRMRVSNRTGSHTIGSRESWLSDYD
ncbi:hypothetical protein FRC12_022972 [Ceratobasidium sp. 428]|nr:hypothetical protein FRC12_022972 [Ceratobasidium sp. 428]